MSFVHDAINYFLKLEVNSLKKNAKKNEKVVKINYKEIILKKLIMCCNMM